MITTGTAIAVARLHGPGDVRVRDEPVPVAGPGETIVHVSAVGLCGSDRHWYLEGGIGDAQLVRPLVLGHEFAGVVAEGPRAGQRVVADPGDPCEACPACLGGASNLCPAMRFAGHGTTDGALRTTMPWPDRLLHPLPDEIADDQAALLEPLAIALHALELGRPRPGGSAGVYGAGPVGLLLVALLRSSGVATIVATDRLSQRLDTAASLGATEIVAVGGDAPEVASPAAATTVDVAFETAGEDGALADAIAAVRPGGRVVLIGIPSNDRTSFQASLARRKGLALLLCRRARPSHLEQAIRLAATGRPALDALISHRFALADAPAAFATLADRSGLKVIVMPTLAGSTRIE